MSVAQGPAATTENAHLLDALEELCERYSLIAIYALGSRANQISTEHLTDVEAVILAIKQWIRTHPERMDETL